MSIVNRWDQQEVTFSDRTIVHEIPSSEITEGVSHFENFIVYKNTSKITVFDRVCDHQGGKIITKADGVSECPLHGWVFNPKSGNYDNVESAGKRPLLEMPTEELTQTVRFETKQLFRNLQNFTTDIPVRIRHLNHGCLIVETPSCKFAIDPWVIGPAFARGWWLAKPSPIDCFEELNSCDFIYVSHNHPDHLHPQSLAEIDSTMPILTGAFESGSTKAYLEDIGFTNVSAMKFDKVMVDAEAQFSLAALKSGDFRDDSGLLFQCGKFSGLLLVDCNFCDFFRFPKNVTLIASTFTSGASGFPLCFETLSENQKKFILSRNRGAVRQAVTNALDVSTPNYFMPYAGMFKESANRDSYIGDHNKKNAVSDYEQICSDRNIDLLDVIDTPELHFFGKDLKTVSRPSVECISDESPETYISRAKKEFDFIGKDVAEQYFLASGYPDNLELYVEECDDTFERCRDEMLYVKFQKGKNPKVQWIEKGSPLKQEYERTGVNTLHIKVRYEAFSEVIQELLPWEDISIGFQCRIDRYPDVYNSNFWFHFTNVYVKANARRMVKECSGCERLMQTMVPSATHF